MRRRACAVLFALSAPGWYAAGCGGGVASPDAQTTSPGGSNDAGDERADAEGAHDSAGAMDAGPDMRDADASQPDADADAADSLDAPSTTDASDDGGDADAAVPALVDPGTGPWIPVAPGDVLATCKLDPQKLADADAMLNVPWAIIRYGRLCHSFKTDGMVPSEAWSTTKTMGATVAGMVAYRTKSIPVTTPMTGPFSDEDRVDRWISGFSYNPEAHVAHVMAMVAQNDDLSLGKKTMVYDTTGSVQINSLSDILNTAIAQDPTNLGTDLDDFTHRHLYDPVGMHDSIWSFGGANKTFAYSWSTTVLDMARLGLLLVHGGMWNGERLLDREWIYRMSHPAFEDGNTGYGYLSWLNSSSNFHYGAILGPPSGLQQGAQIPGPCAPVCIFRTHPHGLSDSPDCGYSPPFSCQVPLDVGVWQAIGLGGQLIQMHPGLDMVIVARDTTPVGVGPQLGTGNAAPKIVWDIVRPAVVAADPKFQGDEAGFCSAYGGSTYAPDLQLAFSRE